MRPRPCLVPFALFVVYIFLLASEAQKVYEFCNNHTSNVININVTSPPVLASSPKYGAGSHQDYQHCSLVIRSGREPLILFLHFNHFDLEYQDTCNYDSLCIHGVKFCGEWLSGQTHTYILPENNFFTLEFKSDINVIKSGFKITVTAQAAIINQAVMQVVSGVGSSAAMIQKMTLKYQTGFSYTDRCSKAQLVYYFCDTSSSSNVVNINTTSPPVVIRSPNYGGVGSYNNNQRCSFILRSETVPLILSLHHNFFDLEPQSNCDFDSICVHGVKFCGNWSAGRVYEYILPEDSSFTLEFKTDGSVIHKGFQITVTTQLAVNQRVEEVTGGAGSNASNIYKTANIYKPRFSYTDRCSNHSQGVVYFCGNSASNITMINATSPPVLIRSPKDLAGTYNNNQSCSLVIKEPLILFLNYNFFDLVYEDSCGNDVLCMHGVKLCGIRETNQTYVIDLRAVSSYTLKINRDSLVTRSGFQIHVSQELTTNKSVQVPTDGFGGHNYTVFTNVTHYPQFPFKDRCMPELKPNEYLPESETTIIGRFVQEQISALIWMAQNQPSYKPLKV